MDNCYNCGASLTPSARFCAACGAPADSEQTRFATEATRVASEETRVAAPRPRAVEPLPARPLAQTPERRAVESGAEEQVVFAVRPRSEEHTSELQSPRQLVCRLLLEKKNEGLSHPAA